MRRNDPLLAPPRSASPRVIGYSPYYRSIRIPLLRFTETKKKEKVSRDPCSRVWPLALALTVEAAVGIDHAFIRVVLVCRRNPPHHLHRPPTRILCDRDMPGSACHQRKHARRQQRHADFPVHTPIVIYSRCGRVGWMLISRESEVSYEINELRGSQSLRLRDLP